MSHLTVWVMQAWSSRFGPSQYLYVISPLFIAVYDGYTNSCLYLSGFLAVTLVLWWVKCLSCTCFESSSVSRWLPGLLSFLGDFGSHRLTWKIKKTRFWCTVTKWSEVGAHLLTMIIETAGNLLCICCWWIHTIPHVHFCGVNLQSILVWCCFKSFSLFLVYQNCQLMLSNFSFFFIRLVRAARVCVYWQFGLTKCNIALLCWLYCVVSLPECTSHSMIAMIVNNIFKYCEIALVFTSPSL